MPFRLCVFLVATRSVSAQTPGRVYGREPPQPFLEPATDPVGLTVVDSSISHGVYTTRLKLHPTSFRIYSGYLCCCRVVFSFVFVLSCVSMVMCLIFFFIMFLFNLVRINEINEMKAMQSHGSLTNASFIQVKSGQTGAKCSENVGKNKQWTSY